MITFWIGTVVGALVGVTTMCIFAVTSEEDRWLEKNNLRCRFCGGKLSEIRTSRTGKKYRYCYGCHLDYEVNDEVNNNA